MTPKGTGERGMTVLESMDEVPDFASEAEEAAFWDTHELGEGILEAMGPLDEVLPPSGSPPATEAT